PDRNPEKFVSSVPNRSISSNSKFGSRLCINNPDRNRGNRIEAGTINRIESSMTGKRGMYK
ncbi:MAG: hypothetical protein WC347_10245, partial [Smithellaceae bacterium]